MINIGFSCFSTGVSLINGSYMHLAVKKWSGQTHSIGGTGGGHSTIVGFARSASGGVSLPDNDSSGRPFPTINANPIRFEIEPGYKIWSSHKFSIQIWNSPQAGQELLYEWDGLGTMATSFFAGFSVHGIVRTSSSTARFNDIMFHSQNRDPSALMQWARERQTHQHRSR